MVNLWKAARGTVDANWITSFSPLHLAEGVKKALTVQKYANLDYNPLCICYPPSIQSGGNYSPLRWSDEVTDENDQHVVVSYGAR